MHVKLGLVKSKRFWTLRLIVPWSGKSILTMCVSKIGWTCFTLWRVTDLFPHRRQSYFIELSGARLQKQIGRSIFLDHEDTNSPKLDLSPGCAIIAWDHPEEFTHIGNGLAHSRHMQKLHLMPARLAGD